MDLRRAPMKVEPRRHFVAAAGVVAGAMMLSVAESRAQGAHPFDPIATVLQHPRCMNCHPRGDTPSNGEEGKPHRMKITRGADDHGAPAARCDACHRNENSPVTFVPGAPHWALAPRSMGWQGLTKGELCAVLKDRSLNGGKDVAALIKHMAEDQLVLWGWNPGKGRAPVPITHDQFVRYLRDWEKAGAPCPPS
jgi:hypothetical protein